MYPDVPMHDIKKILQFGWKSLYLHNSYGGDTLIKDNDLLSKKQLDNLDLVQENKEIRDIIKNRL